MLSNKNNQLTEIFTLIQLCHTHNKNRVKQQKQPIGHHKTIGIAFSAIVQCTSPCTNRWTPSPTFRGWMLHVFLSPFLFDFQISKLCVWNPTYYSTNCPKLQALFQKTHFIFMKFVDLLKSHYRSSLFLSVLHENVPIIGNQWRNRRLPEDPVR